MTPTAIDIQYDDVYNNPGGVRLETIKRAVTGDYQRRPNEVNPFNPGPGAEDLGRALSGFSKTFSKFKVTRKMTLYCKAAVPEDESQYIFVVKTLIMRVFTLKFNLSRPACSQMISLIE